MASDNQKVLAGLFVLLLLLGSVGSALLIMACMVKYLLS